MLFMLNFMSDVRYALPPMSQSFSVANTCTSWYNLSQLARTPFQDTYSTKKNSSHSCPAAFRYSEILSAFHTKLMTLVESTGWDKTDDLGREHCLSHKYDLDREHRLSDKHDLGREHCLSHKTGDLVREHCLSHKTGDLVREHCLSHKTGDLGREHCLSHKTDDLGREHCLSHKYDSHTYVHERKLITDIQCITCCIAVFYCYNLLCVHHLCVFSCLSLAFYHVLYEFTYMYKSILAFQNKLSYLSIVANTRAGNSITTIHHSITYTCRYVDIYSIPIKSFLHLII